MEPSVSCTIVVCCTVLYSSLLYCLQWYWLQKQLHFVCFYEEEGGVYTTTGHFSYASFFFSAMRFPSQRLKKLILTRCRHVESAHVMFSLWRLLHFRSVYDVWPFYSPHWSQVTLFLHCLHSNCTESRCFPLLPL